MIATSDIVFSNWKEHVKEDYGTSRFTKSVTKEVLINLVETFKRKNIDIETISSYQRRVVDFLVTEEGRRGGKSRRTGKDYSNWVQEVKDMFNSVIGDLYDVSQPVAQNQDSFAKDFMQNELVRSWVENKFGYSQDILAEVARDCNSLNLQMQDELFNSEWSRTGENVPEYIKKAIV